MTDVSTVYALEYNGMAEVNLEIEGSTRQRYKRTLIYQKNYKRALMI